MMAARIFYGAILATLIAAGGCVSATSLNESLTQNRSLAAQNRAQLEEIKNLQARMRNLNEQVARAEEQLAKNDSRCDQSLGKLSDTFNTPGTLSPTSGPQPVPFKADTR